MAARSVFACDDVDAVAEVVRTVVDANEQVNQATGNRHAWEAWADDVTTGTNLLIVEVVSNVVSVYSSAAVTKNMGTTGNRWSTVYAVDLNASGNATVSGYYTSGSHGVAVGAQDIAAGDATTYTWWDFTAARLYLHGASISIGSNDLLIRQNVAQPFQIEIATHLTVPNSYVGFGVTANGAIRLLLYGGTVAGTGTYILVGRNSAGTDRLSLNDAGLLTVSQYQNVGTTILATTQGSLAAGITGAGQTYWDAATAVHYWYNASGTVSNQISSVASTNTQFNLTNLDVDLVVRSVNNNFAFVVDAATNRVGLIRGSAPGAAVDISNQSVSSGTPDTYLRVIANAHSGLANTAWHMVDFNFGNATATFSGGGGTMDTMAGAIFRGAKYGAAAAQVATNVFTLWVTGPQANDTNFNMLKCGAINFQPSGTVNAVADLSYSGFRSQGSTITIQGTTTITSGPGFAAINIGRTTLTNSSGCTMNNAASIYVQNSPLAAGSQLISNTYSIWVDDGATRLDGWVNVGGQAQATTNGAFAAGLSGAQSIYWDVTNSSFGVFNSSAAQKIWLDAANIAIGIGVAPSTYRMLGMAETGSGDGSSFYGIETNLTVNANLSEVHVWRLRVIDSGSRTHTNVTGARIDLGALSGASATSVYGVHVLDCSVGTTKIGFYQAGANMHNRFQGGATFGADAAQTNSATVDIQGSLGIYTHGITLAVADLAAGTDSTNALWYDASAKKLFVGNNAAVEWGLVLSTGAAGTTPAAAFTAFGSTGEIRAGALASTYYFTLYAENVERMRFDTAGSGNGAVGNEGGADYDLRWEGDTLAYMLFLDASAATENIALLTTAAPNWQSMDRGLYLGDSTTVPAGDPANGGFLYSESGALKWRGSGGTVTTIATAHPHCPRCGTDYVHEWDSKRWGYLAVCVPCMLGEFERLGGDRSRIIVPRKAAA